MSSHDAQPNTLPLAEQFNVQEQVRILSRNMETVRQASERSGSQFASTALRNVFGHLSIADAYIADEETMDPLAERGARELRLIAGELAAQFEPAIGYPLLAHGELRNGASPEALRLLRVGQGYPEQVAVDDATVRAYRALGETAQIRDARFNLSDSNPVRGEYSLGGQFHRIGERVSTWLVTEQPQPKAKERRRGEHGYYTSDNTEADDLAFAATRQESLEDQREHGALEMWGREMGMLLGDNTLDAFNKDRGREQAAAALIANIWPEIERLKDHPEVLAEFIDGLRFIYEARGFLPKENSS